jgi:hypothetical protein
VDKNFTIKLNTWDDRSLNSDPLHIYCNVLSIKISLRDCFIISINKVCLVRGFWRRDEGILSNFCFPPNWGDLKGREEGKCSYFYYIHQIILNFILKFQNCLY